MKHVVYILPKKLKYDGYFKSFLSLGCSLHVVTLWCQNCVHMWCGCGPSDEEPMAIGEVMDPGVFRIAPILEGKSTRTWGHHTTPSCVQSEGSTEVRWLLYRWVASSLLIKRTGSQQTPWAQNFYYWIHRGSFRRKMRRRCENFEKWLAKILI